MINEQIRDREVRVIGTDGQQLGVMSSRDAQKLADEAELDLIKISPKAKPPVCKIIDYGKYRYELARKEKEAKKKQKTIDIKEGRHPVIEKQLPPGEPYISNSVELDNDKQQIMMITGPNMAGKSALLRQTALIVLISVSV